MSKDKRIIKIYGTFTNGCEDIPLFSGEEIADGTVSEDKLDEELKEKIKGGIINLSDYETKTESQAKLQQAKDYTDARIVELQEGVVTQTIELAKGYNWVSFYVKTSLQDLQSALGNKATLIETSDNGASTANIKTEYNAENNTWSGNLTELNYTLMYQIHCSEACSIEVKGAKLNPSELEYTIVPGTTWISYPLDKELSIAEALVGLSCAEGDQLKSHNSAAQYYNEYGWYAFDLQPMIPGKGYMYVNTTNETKTFYFPSNEEENSDFETKEDALAKLQEAKSYTDIQIQDLKDEVVEQAFEFGEAGTYWISFYIETSLEELCNALGSNGTKISTSTDDTGSENLVLEYNTETGSWSGSLTEIDPLRMYMVTVSAPCTISLKGKMLDTEKSAITLNPGWNWIGYPSDKEISLSEAFVHLNARINDQLKAQSDTATYYGSSMGWYGGVGTLIPGQGYMYKNNSKEIKTLVFSTGEPNYIYETKIDAQVKLEEAKEYTDSRISEIKERVVSQTIELNAGWNWVSFYIDIELVDLQNALGSNGSQIKDYTGKTTTYMSGYGLWSPGGLSTISHHVMYMVNVKESCSITLEGKKLDPDKIDMLISSNTTSWISYPLSVAAELDKALVNVPVVAGDVIKSRDGESEYIDGYGWEGDLTIMEPGKGYQYISNSAESYNFKYPSLEVDVEAELAKKQNTLISGENIKTINGTSILGNGDIVIESSDMSNYAEKEYVDNKTDELRDIVTQTLSLTSGTIWCSFYVDITLEQLQQALGSNAVSITTSFDGNTEVTSSYDVDTNTWSGDLTTLDVTKMYMIAVNTDCEISLTGRKIPNSTSYTLNPGWNWIGYPVNEEINVTDALANLDPKTGDIIKSQNKAAYCTGTSWKVEIGWDRMIPGQGYKYNNTSESVKNLIYTIKSIDVKSELSKKQNTLVSGTNIKTVNGESLLGEGNITIESLPEIPEDSDGKLLKVAGNEYSLKHLTSDDIKKEIYIYLKAGINYVTIFSSYNANAVGGRQVMREVKEQLGDKCEYIKLYKNDGTGTITETTTTYNIETGLWEGELDSITRDTCYVFKMTQTLSISYFTKPINPGATTNPYLFTGQNYLPYTFHKNKTVKEIIEHLTALTPASFNDKLVINHTYTFVYEDIGNGTGKWFPYGDYSDNLSVRPGSGMVYTRRSSDSGVVEWLDDTWDIPDNTVKYIQSKTSECKSYTDDKISSLGVIPQIVYVSNEALMPAKPIEGVLYLVGSEELKQILHLQAGINYVSFYVDSVEGESGMALLEEKLGNNGLHIKNSDAFAQKTEIGWAGSLNSITLDQFYFIEVTESQTIELSGNLINPEDYVIQLTTNYTWIPYPYAIERNISDIIVSFTPNVGDYISLMTAEGSTVIATYTETGWDNDAIMVPGKAYTYYNSTPDTQTLIYPKL